MMEASSAGRVHRNDVTLTFDPLTPKRNSFTLSQDEHYIQKKFKMANRQCLNRSWVSNKSQFSDTSRGHVLIEGGGFY